MALNRVLCSVCVWHAYGHMVYNAVLSVMPTVSIQFSLGHHVLRSSSSPTTMVIIVSTHSTGYPGNILQCCMSVHGSTVYICHSI